MSNSSQYSQFLGQRLIWCHVNEAVAYIQSKETYQNSIQCQTVPVPKITYLGVIP
jgi:hypothetical protein